jgi:hypothetical protein
VPYACVWPTMFCSILFREDISQFVDEDGKPVHGEILDEQDLPEKTIVQFVHEGSMKIVDHLNTFNTLLVQLDSTGVKFESEDKEITLLCSLPASWDHFVTSISFSSTKSIEFDDIVGALLYEETRKKSNLGTSTSEAMVIRGRPKERGQGQRDFSRSKSKGKKSKLKCWFCGKSRHLKKDCWKRTRTSKEDPPKETKEANATKTGSTTGSGMTDEVLSISIGSRQ